MDSLPFQNYTELRELGRGAFASVYLCQHKTSKAEVADKRYLVEHISKDGGDEMTDKCRIHSRLRQRHVVQVLAIFSKPGLLRMHMEYMEGGSLRMLIEEHRRTSTLVDEQLVVSFLRQTLSGLNFIHSSGVMHRDINPSNLLLDNQMLRVKISGFSAASDKATCDEPVGSPPFMAPEVIAAKEYNHKCDIWSLGVTVYELAQLHLPFQAINLIQLWHKMANERHNPLNDRLSDSLRSTLDSMLEKSPLNRPDCRTLRKLQFIWIS